MHLSRLEQEAQTRLASGDTLPPEETPYYGALVDYAKECRPLLNQGQYQLPEPPKLSDFDQSLQDYIDSYEGEASYTDTLARHLIPTTTQFLQLHA